MDRHLFLSAQSWACPCDDLFAATARRGYMRSSSHEKYNTSHVATSDKREKRKRTSTASTSRHKREKSARHIASDDGDNGGIQDEEEDPFATFQQPPLGNGNDINCSSESEDLGSEDEIMGNKNNRNEEDSFLYVLADDSEDNEVLFFSGYCCFQVNLHRNQPQYGKQPKVESSVASTHSNFLFFGTNELDDDAAQLRLQLTGVKVRYHLNAAIRRPAQPFYMLCATFDNKRYFIDTSKIIRMSKPPARRQEAESIPPYVSFEFPNVIMRFYSAVSETEEDTYEKDVKLLYKAVDTMFKYLNPMPPVVGSSSQSLSQPRASQEQQHTQQPKEGPLSTHSGYARHKYASWARFINQFNSSIRSLLQKGSSEDPTTGKDLSDIVSLYMNAKTTRQDKENLKALIMQQTRGLDAPPTAIVTPSPRMPSPSPPLIKQESPLSQERPQAEGFYADIDSYVDGLMRGMDARISNIFSFTHTNTLPTQESLQDLEDHIQKINEVSQTRLLLSILPTRDFSI